MELRGTITALITPLIDKKIDEDGFCSNIRYQIANGINGLLLFGSTGESSTITEKEQERLISLAVNEVNGAVPIFVGTGHPSTEETLNSSLRARDLGADAVLIVTPYYIKPTQEGIFRHFQHIAMNIDIPIVVYNIFGRSGVNIETPTLLKIAQLPNIIGVKEASGSVSQAGDVVNLISSKYPHFSVISGDDNITLPMMSVGATGVISIASNLIPGEMVSLVNAMQNGELSKAQEIHHRLLSFFKLLFIETNPIPIKEMMNMCGLAAGDYRLPLCELTLENREKVRCQMELLGLVQEAKR